MAISTIAEMRATPVGKEVDVICGVNAQLSENVLDGGSENEVDVERLVILTNVARMQDEPSRS
jgi:hypothetical protein